MKRWKTRHKFLLGLMLATTVIMVIVQLWAVYYCYFPRTELEAIFGLSVKDRLIINTLYFIPIYLGVLLLWFLGVKIAEAINRRK